MDQLARTLSRVGPHVDDDNSVDNNELHTYGILMRIFKSCEIANVLCIKDRDISVKSFFEQAAVWNRHRKTRLRS